MKTYLLKRKTFSWTIRHMITDENDQVVFVVKSKPFGATLFFEDYNGNILFEIKRKFWSSKFTHHIYSGDEMVATILYKRKFKGPFYQIKTNGYGEYLIKGDRWAKDYVVMRHDLIVSEIMENRKTWAKDYFVRVYDNEEPEFILCITAVMDRIRLKRKQAKSS